MNKRDQNGRQGPRLRQGARIGRYSEDQGRKVWTRSVSVDRHLLRIRNAWAVNDPIAQQLAADGVELIRYTLPTGTEEVELGVFLALAERLPGFARGEDVLCLPRSLWRSHPSSGLLDLFSTSQT